jgi:hypothetical protein
LTKFLGFPFGREHPFDYLEGKRTLGPAVSELRGRRDLQKGLGMNPNVPGRGAIGRQRDRVWDFLSLSTGPFTRFPHLTLGITSTAVEAWVTIPNGVNPLVRRTLKELGEAGFRKLAREIVDNLKPRLRDHKGAAPWCRGEQQRFISRHATPIVDGTIDFDLRTALPDGPPKNQPIWLSAAYGAFVKKEGNYQMLLGVLFSYERCPELKNPAAIDLIAEAWLACKPLVDLLR